MLYAVLYRPLENKNVPTIGELRAWLKEDSTDMLHYKDPDFICGDFATMLPFHAKIKDWDMGVVAIFGHNEKGEKIGHVFNAIVCAEGVVYVESQSDTIWWNDNFKEIVRNWYDFPDFGRIYVEQYIVIVLYE